MDVVDFSDNETGDQIAGLEARIEELAAKLENCRKIAITARVAVGVGIAIFIVGLTGFIRFDITTVLASMTAVIGGLVLLGSNSSTANEAADEIAKTEGARAALIGSIRLRVVGGNTLH